MKSASKIKSNKKQWVRVLLLLSALTGASQPLPELKIEEEGEWGEEPSEVVMESPEKGMEGALKALSFIQLPDRGAGASPVFLIRGMDSQQNRIFIEGIPLSEPVFQSGNVLLLPPFSIQSVSVFSSAIPTQFMMDGMGGALNLRLSTPQMRNRFLGKFGNLGFVKVAGQANLNSQTATYLSYFQSQENFSYFDNNGTPFNSDDDQVKVRDHNGFKMFSLLPTWQWKNAEGVRVNAFSLNGIQASEIPGSIYNPEFYDLTQFTHLTGIKTIIPLGNALEMEALGSFRFQRDLLNSKQESETKRISKNTGLTSPGAQLAFRWNVAPSFSTSWGVGGRFSKRLSEETNTEIPFFAAVDMGSAVSWKIQPAVFGQYIPGGTTSEVHLSPRIAGEYRLHPLGRLRGQVGNYFRRPSLSELYGNNAGLEANPDLKNETGFKSELGTDWFFEGARNVRHKISLTLFAAQTTNLISFFPSSASSRKPQNIGRAVWMGQELQYEVESPLGWKVRPSLVRLQTRNDSPVVAENGRALPWRFPWVARLDISFERGQWNMGYRGSVFSRSFLDVANQQEMGSYSLHDLFVGVSLKQLGRFEFDVLNLFDVQSVVSSQGGAETFDSISGVVGYPVAGRRVGLSWWVDF